MLVLQRQPQQPHKEARNTIIYDIPPSTEWRRIVMQVIDIHGQSVRIGSEADDDVVILRGELERAA